MFRESYLPLEGDMVWSYHSWEPLVKGSWRRIACNSHSVHRYSVTMLQSFVSQIVRTVAFSVSI
jgi:hypothetical protein